MKKKKIPYKVSARLDLHNLTIQSAYDKTKQFLESCRFNGHKYVRVITGKSGEIYREFPFWIESLGYSTVQSDIGSFIVKIQ